MPAVSPNAWKILVFTIRRTWGWADDDSSTGRREWDQISYSQFRNGTGIKSDTTVQKAIEECIKAGYLLRKPIDEQNFKYRLNESFEVEVKETSTVSKEVESDTSTEIKEATPTETVEEKPITSTVSVDTKERYLNKGENKNPADAGADAPQPTEPILFGQWLQNVQKPPDGSNRVAQLKTMHDVLFPDHDPVDFGRIGRTAQRVGGAGRLAQLLWETVPKRPNGNVCDYIEAVENGRRHKNGASQTVGRVPTF